MKNWLRWSIHNKLEKLINFLLTAHLKVIKSIKFDKKKWNEFLLDWADWPPGTAERRPRHTLSGSGQSCWINIHISSITNKTVLMSK